MRLKVDFYDISSSLLVVVVPCAIWKWRSPLGKITMNSLAKVGRVIRCGWLRYEPQDDEEVYDDLIQRSKQETAKRGSVKSAIAQFEQTSTNAKSTKEEVNLSKDVPSCSEKAMSGAYLFFGLFRGSTDASSSPDKNNSNNLQAEKIAASVRAQSSKNPTCLVCQKKIFPTDESTAARNKTYHAGCFKCTLCKSKLKNHPDEEHQLVGGMHYLYLQCRRCKVDNEQKYKPRQVSRVAGEKIVVEGDEQGDIEQVVDAIGDDLEEAIYAMIPRCATCGGDFLHYKGEVSIVGCLKYHQECFLTGKPSAGTASLTMDPTQAAKYLPQDIILRLVSGSGKVLSTLFFVWNDKDEALKSMRSMERTNAISVTYHLDDDARANPNHPSNRNNTKKTMVALPQANNGDENIDLKLDLVGGDQISPQAPLQEGAVSISSGYQTPPTLQAKIGYSKYNLRHSLLLQTPCNATCDVLELLGTTLTVSIQETPV